MRRSFRQCYRGREARYPKEAAIAKTIRTGRGSGGGNNDLQLEGGMAGDYESCVQEEGSIISGES